MHFVRNQVRLNCDLNTVYKNLTDQVKIRQWSAVVPNDIQSVNRNQIKWSVCSPISEAQMLEFYVMSCTESTEYCTEIHLITNLISDEKATLDQFSKEILEQLRFHFNKAWIIQDKDLTLSSLKRSR